MSATIKPVGHGANGTAAYVVLDEREKYVCVKRTGELDPNRQGAFLFNLRQAQDVQTKYNQQQGVTS